MAPCTELGGSDRGRSGIAWACVWCTRCRPQLCCSCDRVKLLRPSCSDRAPAAKPARPQAVADISSAFLSRHRGRVDRGPRKKPRHARGPAAGAGGGRPRKPPSASDASLFASTPADEPWPASLVQYEQLRPAGGPRCRRIARRVEQFRSAHHAPASPGPSGRAKSNSRTWSGTCQSIEAALHVFLDVEGLAGC